MARSELKKPPIGCWRNAGRHFAFVLSLSSALWVAGCGGDGFKVPPLSDGASIDAALGPDGDAPDAAVDSAVDSAVDGDTVDAPTSDGALDGAPLDRASVDAQIDAQSADRDNTAPTIVSVTPSSAVNVEPTTSVVATFSEPIDPSSITASTFSMTYRSPNGDMGTVTGSHTVAGATATLRPTGRLGLLHTHSVEFSHLIKDLTGNEKGRKDIEYFNTRDGTWIGQTQLESSTDGVTEVRIVGDSPERMVVVWTQTSGSHRAALWARQFLNGTWGQPSLIETDSAKSVHAFDVAGNSRGEVLVAWRTIDTSANESIRASLFRSGAWTAPEVLTTLTSTQYARGRVPVALNGNTDGLVAWTQYDDVTGRSTCYRRTLLRGLFSATTNTSMFISSTQINHRAPLVAINESGTQLAAWQSTSALSATGNLRWQQNVQTSTAPNSSWTTQDLDVTGRTAGEESAIAVDSLGNAYVTFQVSSSLAATTAVYESYASVRPAVTNSWTAPQVISADPAIHVSTPGIALGAEGSAEFLFLQGYQLRGAVYTPASTGGPGTFLAPELLSQPSRPVASYDVASSDKVAIVTWVESSGDIYARRWLAGGWVGNSRVTSGAALSPGAISAALYPGLYAACAFLESSGGINSATVMRFE